MPLLPYVFQDTLDYYRCLWYFLVQKGALSNCPYFKNRHQARVHLYSLAVVIYLFDKPHYRNGTYQQDMIKNLRDVAVPGTGVPLSLFCYQKWVVLFYFVFLYPLVCFVAGVYAGWGSVSSVMENYKEQLLCPKDWFSFWQINCRLASFHSLVMGSKAPGYAMEDKWLFLQKAQAAGIPVSPWLTFPRVVLKDKNEEGGMGIRFYHNAAHGGDWIIQEVLDNADSIAHLLPHDAPLSTLRIITASTYGIPDEWGELPERPPADEDIKSLSCVFRAGRSGAATDHSSVLFDVDLGSGIIGRGTSNSHWYQLGLTKALRTPWVSTHDKTQHPDCGVVITGEKIPEINEIKKLVEQAHKTLLPDVPLGGWDVALTTQGMLLLEVNLSCNFFRGTFNLDSYVEMTEKYFSQLDRLVRERETKKKK